MEKLKRIAAVHDISGYGKCSLTVALPIISASGVECSCIPTALLSTHTGDFEGFTFKDLSDEILPIARHWKKEKIEFDGVYSGYLASADQAKLLEQAIEIIKSDVTQVIVDPVMADHGEYYTGFDDKMAKAFVELSKKADILTPNITEAAFMTGISYEEGPHSEEYINSLLKALSEICGGTIVLTGVKPTPDSIGAAAIDNKTGEKIFSYSHLRQGVFHGTGDLFSSAFAALFVRGAGLKNSIDLAIMLVTDSIDRSLIRKTSGRDGVDFEGALPRYITELSKLFKD